MSDSDCTVSVHRAQDPAACSSWEAAVIVRNNKNHQIVLWIPVASQLRPPQSRYDTRRNERPVVHDVAVELSRMPVYSGGNVHYFILCYLGNTDPYTP